MLGSAVAEGTKKRDLLLDGGGEMKMGWGQLLSLLATPCRKY